MDRAIIHIDMDAFYASIEQRDNPCFKNKPVIIGGRSKRAVVCTASYEARKYGIHSAMPMAKAKRLCPKGIYLPVNMDKYKRESRKIMNILGRYSKIIEPLSIDEAFIDVTGKDALSIAKQIKKDIKNELQLTASIGISANKFMAKLASDVEKPDGLTIIKKEDIINFLKPLQVSKLWGVGPRMERELNKLGIYIVEDVQKYNLDILIKKFGKKGKEIYNFSFGIDNRPVETHLVSQSIGEEETFLKDINDIGILCKKLRIFSINLSNKLVKKGFLVKTITVKVKYSDFTVETRSFTFSIPTYDSNIIYETSKHLLISKFNLTKNIRLLGISFSNLIYPHDPIQLSFEI